MFTNNWFFEDDMPLAVAFQIEKSLFSSKSKYQKIEVLQSINMGKIMLLDDKLMITEKDEFYYHETIAHCALAIHQNPKKVIVVGGGDGGTVREVLKYETIKEVELVEIDEEVINISKRFFPTVASELGNSKLQVKVCDAINYIKKLPRTISNIEYSKQLIRSSGSVPANYIEANESLGDKDFKMKIKICKKESKESKLWLDLTEPTSEYAEEQKRLLDESNQFIKIFFTIIRNSD